ncbi:MAG TPA: acetate--CoA ligase family protein, partial [Pseudorhodoferax sp.]|nr:acetate--CoA ligase family protein [Pseudorhodoferax sp.]
ADYAGATDALSQVIAELAPVTARPIVPVWMSRQLAPGFHVMENSGLAPFMSLSQAMAAVRKALGTVPNAEAPQSDHAASAVPATAPALVACNEASAKDLLKGAGIAVPQGVLALNAEAASAAAAELGCPVVMKVASAQILHKTEVGGVRLNIASAEQARTTFEDIVAQVSQRRPDARIDGVLVERMLDARGREMLVGIHTDPAFGRVMTVGLGGVFVELLKDVSHRVLPIRDEDARAMLGELRHAAYLGAFRDKSAADMEALVELLVRIPSFAMAHPDIEEAEFNPVWVGPEGQGAFALDALVLRRLATTSAAAALPA